jgi:DNA-binding MarR family transcriptional regulator
MPRTGRSDSTDRAILETLDAFRRVLRVIRSSARRAERELGVSGAQLFVLQQLVDGPVDSLNALAERTYTHQSSVSVVVRRLVERGLVIRRASPRDARQIQIGLSPSGRALLRQSGPAVQVRLIRAMRKLSPGQCTQLASLLGQVVKQMGLAGTPAPMISTDMQTGESYGSNRGHGRRRPAALLRRREEAW